MRTPRQGHLGVWTTALAGLLLCLPIADALGAFQPVRPILECVTQEGPAQYTAVYGYKNENAFPLIIPIGPRNKFTPSPQDRGQPTVFWPGRTPPDRGVFQVPFDGGDLVWTLKGPDGSTRTATASGSSRRCPGPTLTGLDPVSLFLMQGGSKTLTATIGAAQPSATSITLRSSDPAIASVPASVSIPAGQEIVAVPVAAGNLGIAVVTASLNGVSRHSIITVLPGRPTLTSLVPATIQVTQGATGTLTVTISAAQASDTVIPLSTSDAGVVGLPGGNAVTVPAGQLAVAVPVAGLAPGGATVTAGPLNGTSAQSQVTVIAPPAAVVGLAPAVLPLSEGSAGTLTVTLNASQPTDTEVTLTTSDPAVVGLPADHLTVPAHTLSAGFTVTGLALGTATIAASVNGAGATSAVTVQPPLPTVQAFTCPATLTVGATAQCTVTLNATQLTDTLVPLATSDPGIVTVPESVTVLAGAVAVAVPVAAGTLGTATLTAGPLHATTAIATVQVQPPPPTLVGLTPSPATLLVGASTTLTLTLTAAPVTDTAVALVSNPTGIVTLPPSITVPAGQIAVPVPVSALTVGSAVLTAGPLNGSTVVATVTVNQLPPAVTALTPSEVTLPKGTADSLTVTIAPVQADPTAVPLTSSDQATVEVPASVPIPAGSATAAFPVIGRTTGTATITAGPLGGTTAQATVIVTPPALVTLSLAPTAVSLAAGQTQAFVATGTYTDGTTQDLAPTATWTSSNEAVATVTNPGGIVTARAVGQATITATAEGKSATATISVTPPILTVLALTPTPPTRAVGQSIQFQVTGTYTDGATQDLTGTVTWTSSNTAAATITSPGGLATALAAGPTTIIATHADGMSVSTTLTVTAPVVTNLALHPTNTMLVVGQTLQLTVLATFTNGTTQDLTAQVAWSSGAPLVASVSGAGLVAGLTSGTTTVTASHPAGPTASTTLTVLLPLPTLASLEPQFLSIIQGGSGTLTVTISAVQAGETAITLTNSAPAVAIVPATIIVPGGSVAVAVPVVAVSPGTATITATLNGSSRQSNVTVQPGVTLTSLLPTTLAVRQGAFGPLTVTLSAVQGTDTVVTLTSGNAAIVAGPPEGTVTIPAGQRSQTIAVAGVSPGAATITAALNGSTGQTHVTVTIASPTVVRLEPAVLAFAGESTGTFTVTLNATQPTDTEILLAASDEWAITLSNDRVIVPANQPSATFTVAAADGGLATVTATLNGSTVTAAALAWWSLPGVRSLTCASAIAVGATGRCTVILNFIQSTDTAVPLTGSAPDVLAFPASVTIPANTGSATVEVTGVAVGNAQVTAGPLNGTTRQTTVQVIPATPTLVSVLPSPAGLALGAVTALTVTLNSTQPTDTRIPVTSNVAGIVNLPATVTVPAGSLTASMPVTGLATGATTVTLGPLNGTQTQTTLTVNQLSPTVIAVTPAEPTVVEWNAVSLTVTLSAAHPEPTVISLTSSDPDIVTVPATVTVPAGALSAALPVLGWVPGTATVTIGPLNGSSVLVPVTVVPWELVSFAIVPPTVTIAVGQSQRFMAIAAYNDEILEDKTESAWWAADDETIARFAERGVATALAPGTTTIHAGVGEGLSATPATLTVTPAVVATLILTPTGPIRAVGESVQFRVAGTFTDGTTQDVTPAVTWTSSSSAVATITSPGGLATSVAPGSTTITAAYPGVPSTSTTLTVAILAPTLDSLVPNRGRVGMAVNLFGTNLGATSEVRFNGTPAAFTVQSITQVTATVPVGAATGRVAVTTPSGAATSSGNFMLTGPPTVAITSPAQGATITGTSVQVRGTVTSDTAEVGVMVNGLAAQVNGGQWAVTVPLSSGSNTLTATATDAAGAQATTSITVTATEASPSLLVLRAVPDSGVAPLTVRWQVTNQTGRPLVQYALDERGVGTFNPPLTVLDGVQTTYTTPGLVHPILRATDDQGTLYLATTTINVLPVNQTDALLRAKWNGMKAALQANAVETAVSSFSPSQQARYRTLFTALAGQLSRIATDMEEIELVQVVGRQAQYRLQRTEEVGGKPERVSYYIYFVQGQDGVWRIREF